MLCVMMLPLVVVGCIKAVCQSVREATTASGVDNAASRLADAAEQGYFTLRGWSLCKNNWKEPRSILMSSADRVAHIDGQLMQLLWAIHTRLTEYKCLKVIKPSNPFTNVCWVSVANIFCCAATNFGCIDSFSSANSRNGRNDGWWFSFGATAAGLFEQ